MHSEFFFIVQCSVGSLKCALCISQCAVFVHCALFRQCAFVVHCASGSVPSHVSNVPSILQCLNNFCMQPSPARSLPHTCLFHNKDNYFSNLGFKGKITPYPEQSSILASTLYLLTKSLWNIVFKRDAGNAVLNKHNKTLSATFSAFNGPIGFCLLYYLGKYAINLLQ